MVTLTLSRASSGKSIKDSLSNGEYGINHGETHNGIETLEEIVYITHDGVNQIDNLILYVSNATTILQWGSTIAGDGVLLDSNNDGTFDKNFNNSLGSSALTGINIGTILAGAEKVIKLKVKIPDTVDEVSIYKFNLNFDFDFTS